MVEPHVRLSHLGGAVLDVNHAQDHPEVPVRADLLALHIGRLLRLLPGDADPELGLVSLHQSRHSRDDRDDLDRHVHLALSEIRLEN